MTQFETTTGQARSHIANYILIIAALLLLFSYPFRDLFWGGLIMHLSGAALIGGLADWYAVTALFRRPLGISFKTALIPSSKERIAETARHMIESEILTVPNMYQVLKHHPSGSGGAPFVPAHGKGIPVGRTRPGARPQHVFVYPGHEKNRRSLFRYGRRCH